MIKFKPSPKYDTASLYALITLAAVCAFIFALFKLSDIWSWLNNLISIIAPFLYGFVIAYLCNPLAKFYDRKLLGFIEKKKPHKNLRRNMCGAKIFWTAP